MTTILVVEDDPALRRALRTMMRSRDLDVVEAETGEEAVVVTSAGGADLLVLDLGLPDIDGLHVLRALRTGTRSTHVPVMVLTGRADRDTELRAIQEGADDYIRKPIDPPIFLARSKAAWRRSRAS